MAQETPQPAEPTPTLEPAGPAASAPRRRRRIRRLGLAGAGAVVVLTAGFLLELRTSWLQARYLSRQAARLTVAVGPGPSPAVRFPGDGPYDVRYGYSRLPAIIEGLAAGGFVIDSQARMSARFIELMDRGLSPVYHARSRAGFRILDGRGDTLFDGAYPERAVASFDEIPPLVWRTLLFVEDRKLLDAGSPWRNPAVDWPRLFRAATDLAARTFGRSGSVAGASTLATQLEKFRHAPEGRTQSNRDKLRQMASASLRAYLDGPETREARQRIVTDYINSLPLAGIAGRGEITGLADGLDAWFGADVDEVFRLLRQADDPGVRPDAERHGRAYRQVLSLLMAVQRPSYFLADSAGRVALARRSAGYLDLMVREGAIPAALGEAARDAVAPLRTRAPERPSPSFIERKAANAVRTGMLTLGGFPALYQLDRFDATARTTIHAGVQDRVTRLLTRLNDPGFVQEQGLAAFRLLDRGDPGRVQYAFVLHERTPRGNAVRVQTDNVDAPFSLIGGAKLELGSTAKLRTLVSYLEAVERAYREYALALVEGTAAPAAAAGDAITAWVRDYLTARPGAQRVDLLTAAMDRRYSASPAERFFTGGGLHTFSNFESTHNSQVLTVREAFRHSVNLVFIRMMRDVVQFHMARLTGHPWGMLGDRDDPRRQEYLARFADREGRVFLGQFLRKHQWASREEALAELVRDRSLSPTRLAWMFRSVAPDATADEFAGFLAGATEGTRSPERVRELFTRADPARTPLVDRAFLAGIHPLELWLVEFRLRHPGTTRAEAVDSSREVRQEVYQWLFATRRTAAQNQRIRSILEVEAFFEIHRAWSRLGYPFASLVPSYATAIGSSADRPDQLAELVGILLNNGVRMPSFHIEELRLAEGTPWETILRPKEQPGERVLSAPIAAVVREAMIDVVQAGTARRAMGAVRAPDGSALAIGAKTGTGNNRFRVFGRGGRILEDRALNRTSTLVFFIGDRFYGTLTAYVPGARADDYGFTSSLPAQILRLLGPALGEL